MKKPLYVRELSEAERGGLRAGLKSKSGFSVRRSQMLLMSGEEKLKVDEIGGRLGCTGQAVREAIHAFEKEGLACLEAKSHARKSDQRAYDEAAQAHLSALIHESPRAYGYERSVWNLSLLGEVSYRQGWVKSEVDADTVGDTLKRMGITWRRAKGWISSPDPHYEAKKKGGIG
jgi:transposase